MTYAIQHLDIIIAPLFSRGDLVAFMQVTCLWEWKDLSVLRILGHPCG